MDGLSDRRYSELVNTNDITGYKLFLRELKMRRDTCLRDTSSYDEKIKTLHGEIDPLKETIDSQSKTLAEMREVNENQERIISIAKKSFNTPTQVRVRSRQINSMLDQPVNVIEERKEKLKLELEEMQKTLQLLQGKYEMEMNSTIEDARHSLDHMGETVMRVKEKHNLHH